MTGRARKGSGKKFIESMADFTDDCITYPYGKANRGYSETYINTKRWSAHRYSLFFHVSAPPDSSMIACHSCGKGHLGCINPRHLYWGTFKTNSEDREAHGTLLKGQKNPKALITEKQAAEVIRLCPTMSSSEISKQLNIPISIIRPILAGSTWSHIPRTVTRIGYVGENHYNAKLNDEKVRSILSMLCEGKKQSDIAHQFSVTKSIVGEIFRNETWKHIDRSPYPLSEAPKSQYAPKLNEESVRSVLASISAGVSLSEIARKLQVSVAAISAIKHGKTWKHIPRDTAV